MAKKKTTEVFHLVCKECGSRNYTLKLRKENKGLKLKKYCSKERKHIEHSAKKA